jgi:hypothetical protein
MPEDTRVQQQVHMHIWMEADIIMVIVSDARRAVKSLSICLDANFGCKESKNPLFRTSGFRQGGVELRSIRDVRRHQAGEHHTHLDP